MSDKFKQCSSLMDDVQFTIDLTKVNNYPLVNQLFIEVQGELLQLTLAYMEQCAKVVEKTINRMNKDRLQ